MSENLAKARAAALNDIKLTDDQPAPTWRVIMTDSESPTGLAPVCTGERSDALHMIHDYPGGPIRDEQGVYDCCPWPQIETYSTVWAAYLAELLNADAEEKPTAEAPTAELLPKADVVAWLVKKSREEKSWDAAVLASKVARGAVRPNNLRMPPDFFEPGHSYTHRNSETFHCVAVTDHPQTGERLAMGWHIDSWGLHYPTTVGINQWNHEYDGVQPPASTEGGAK